SFSGQKHKSEFENSSLSLSCFSSFHSFSGQKNTSGFENSDSALSYRSTNWSMIG
ncbi:hypothetical protein LINPERHAP1_LOCUS3076, partial [Linum perenne]